MALYSAKITDLNFARNSPLVSLAVSDCKGLHDLTPLRGKPLVRVTISRCPVKDLSPLRGLPIEDLSIDGCPIADYSPLMELPKLKRLRMYENAFAFGPLRTHPSIEQISFGTSSAYRPVAEVWAEYDAQQAAEKE